LFRFGPRYGAPVADLDSIVQARLAADGQRYTAGRRAIVARLERSQGPLTIPELVQSGTGMAQSSIYRNLTVLEATGVVLRLVTDDDFARYELAPELTEHHHHLICTACGGIEDVVIPDDLETELDDCLRDLASRRGFAGVSHRLDLLGLCVRCRP
jgi:Fur family transcriptional regulator, ferric uptake regulator